MTILGIFSALFVIALGLGALALAVMYVVDITQTTHAIRRNYPVVGRFRYAFETMGEFFRQYFFAMDREELPFNRAERAWAYRRRRGQHLPSVPHDLRPAGTASSSMRRFRLDEEEPIPPVTIGPYCRHFYRPLFHISAMSFGAISKPAVIAVRAPRPGCWLNTGRWPGPTTEGGADVSSRWGPRGVRMQPVSSTGQAPGGRASAGEDDRVKLSPGAKPGKGGILPAARSRRRSPPSAAFPPARIP
jgi:glutamate synthase domain-containing protein 2